MCTANPVPEIYAAAMFFTWAIALEILYFGKK